MAEIIHMAHLSLGSNRDQTSPHRQKTAIPPQSWSAGQVLEWIWFQDGIGRDGDPHGRIPNAIHGDWRVWHRPQRHPRTHVACRTSRATSRQAMNGKFFILHRTSPTKGNMGSPPSKRDAHTVGRVAVCHAASPFHAGPPPRSWPNRPAPERKDRLVYLRADCSAPA